MEEFNILKKLERIKAPPDFEQKVMAQISLRRRQIRTRTLRLSLAGAFSAIVVLFIVVNVFFLPQKSPLKFVGGETEISSSLQESGITVEKDFIPIIESVDYTGEIQSVSQDPSTIYILEQVSDETSAEIKY